MNTNKLYCLNPCFNGRYSQRCDIYLVLMAIVCLNPCFNGRYSQRRPKNQVSRNNYNVLILVLMEDTLRELK